MSLLHKELPRHQDFHKPGSQLISLGAQAKSLGDMLSSVMPDVTKLSLLQSMSGELQGLALRYSGIVQSPGFTRSIADLTQSSVLLNQLRTVQPPDLLKILPQLQKVIYDLSDAH